MSETDGERMTDEEFQELLEDRISRVATGEYSSKEEVEDVFSDC